VGAKWEGVSKICDFWPSRCISVKVREWPRLLLITNRKSYTGSRLAPNSMTLNDLKRQNRELYGFLAISGCDTRLCHSQGGATTELSLCDPLIQIDNLVFVYQLSVNRNCYRLPRVSWALAQISCFSFTVQWTPYTKLRPPKTSIYPFRKLWVD